MGKNYVESSLKRFLKRKVKITMGFVVAFMITGVVSIGAEHSSPIEVSDEDIKVENDEIFTSNIEKQEGQSHAISAVNKGKISINSNNIDIIVKNEKGNSFGAIAETGGIVNLGNEKTEKIKIISNVKNDGWVIGLYLDSKGKMNLKAKEVIIEANGGKESGSHGIYCITKTTVDRDVSKIKIDADKTVIKVGKEGSSRGIVLGQ